MKKFIIKSILFGVIVITIISLILIKAGGYVDYFYEKFTTPKAHSMILGDSRSMQGVQPKVINNYKFDKNYQLPILNYSFTIAQIAYGPIYTESIKRKLDKLSTTKGMFILTVNPWVLSSREEDDENNGVFFEKDMPPHNMEYINMNPNFEYFIKNFNYFHFKSIVRRTSKMHKDGWLEESNLPSDSTVLNNWKKKQISIYKSFSLRWEKSFYRLKSLGGLIKYLKKYGDVFLVRLPVDEKILEVENVYWKDFNIQIDSLAFDNKVQYIDYTNRAEKFETYDGNHIDKFGGVKFTKSLCNLINMKK